MSARRLLIHGVVQGVGFRATLAGEAQQQRVTGWVRNRREGAVEALLCGEDEAVAAMIAWARQGPPGARVSHIEISAEEIADSSLMDFRQLPTF